MDAVNEASDSASEVFRVHLYELSLVIGPSISRVTTALYSKQLLSMETKDKVTTTSSLSEHDKAMIVVSTLEKQLRGAGSKATDDLVEICCVLRVQNNRRLREKSDLILGQLKVDLNTLPTYVKYTIKNVHEHITDVSTEMSKSIKSILDSLEDVMRHIELIKEAKFLEKAKSFYKMFIDFNKSVYVFLEKVQHLLHCCSAGGKADQLIEASSQCAKPFEECLKAHDDVYKGAKLVSHQCEALAIEFKKKQDTIGHEEFVSFIGRLTSLMDSDTSSSSKDEEFKSTMHNLQDVSGKATALSQDEKRYKRFQEYFEKIVHILCNLSVPAKCLAEKVQCLSELLESSEVMIPPAIVSVPSIKEYEEKLNEINSIFSAYAFDLELD